MKKKIGDVLMNQKGKLIVIEGNDCSGKQTQGTLLVENLKKMGYPAIYLSFPMYDTPTGRIIAGPILGKEEFGPCFFEEGIDLDPYIASLYYAADRKYNIKKVQDYLDQGYFVILDRYISSNMAHQSSKIEDDEKRFYLFQWVDKLEYWLLGLPKPDQTIFLHVPYKVTVELLSKRGHLDIAEKSTDNLKRAEKTYIELSELYHWDHIDCVKDEQLLSIEEISQKILNSVLKKESV